MEQQNRNTGRTDLALEVRESFPQDDVEIQGVVLKEEYKCGGRVKETVVQIVNEEGATQMGKPVGNYLTLEIQPGERPGLVKDGELGRLIGEILDMLGKQDLKKSSCIVCLGNRLVTPDALGPFVLDELMVTRHLIREWGEEFKEKHQLSSSCAIAPGVMAQTGMESMEIIQGVIGKVKPTCILAIDALAARNVGRLNMTIQITDTGISPGAGVGNNRKELNQETLGIPVIALGVPTVVDATTIVVNRMEEALSTQGLTEDEIQSFLGGLSLGAIENMFVTPKDIDEAVHDMAVILADGINGCFCGNILSN